MRLEDTVVRPRIAYLAPVALRARMANVVYGGILGSLSREGASAAVRCLAQVLRQGGADVISFGGLQETSPVLVEIESQVSSLLRSGGVWQVHREMTLPKEPGALLANMRSKHRSWIRRKERQLAEDHSGRVTEEWMRVFDDIPGLCARLEKVAATTYQRGLGAGFADNEEHRRRYEFFARRGMLRAYIMSIDGVPKAFWSGTVYQGVFHSAVTGYDARLRDYELGTLVFVHMVDELIREGVCRLDFGLGDAHYKERFGDRFWHEADFAIYSPSLRGAALRAASRSAEIAHRLGERTAARLGFVSKIKKAWRDRLRRPGAGPHA